MNQRSKPFADFGQSELDLLDEQARLEIFQGIHSIWVPHNMQIEKRSLAPRAPAVPCLVYAVPERLLPEVTDANLYDLAEDGTWGWGKDEAINAESWRRRWDGSLQRRPGLHDGLRGGADTSRLIKDFVALAQGTPQTELPEPVLEKVKKFVEIWGPLWLCRTPEHHAHGRRCYWNPRQRIYWGGTTRLCSWRPIEEISSFVWEAQQAGAVLQAFGKLKQNNLVDQDIWQRMGIRPPARSIPEQRLTLMGVVDDRLAAHHGPLQMRMVWFRNLKEPMLSLASRIGFIHAVWIGITQILCGVRELSTCTGCGWPYIRDTKARAGQGNYCAECSRGKGEKSEQDTQRTSKKLSARRKRELQRQARQLYAEGVSCEDLSQQLNPSSGRIKVDPETIQKWVSPGSRATSAQR